MHPDATAEMGGLHALALVHVWARLPLRGGKTRHPQVDPTEEEIAAYIDARREELQHVYGKFVA